MMFAVKLLMKLREMTRRAEKAETRLDHSMEQLKDYAIHIGALPEESRNIPMSVEVIIDKIDEQMELLEDQRDKQVYIVDGLLETMGRFKAIVDNASNWQDIEEAVAHTDKFWNKDPQYIEGYTLGLEYSTNMKKYNAATALNNAAPVLKF